MSCIYSLSGYLLKGSSSLSAIRVAETKLKSLLMRMKEESGKAGLKLNIEKQIMASDPITPWQTEGEKVETVTGFLFLGPKIIVEGYCSHEIKRGLLLRRKAMANLNSILESRDISLLTKLHIIEAMVFQSSGTDLSWTIKKAEF